jgi:hypothetical protein
LGFEGRWCGRYAAFAFTVIRDLRHTLRTVVGLSALKAVQERQITPNLIGQWATSAMRSQARRLSILRDSVRYVGAGECAQIGWACSGDRQ